jgi:hypothetical protein
LKSTIGQRYSSGTKDALIKFRKLNDPIKIQKDQKKEDHFSMIPRYRGHIPG